jgi:hypothetical protein
MTPAAAFLDRLRQSGVSVSLRPNGKLWMQPKAALTPELLAAAKGARDELAALLVLKPPARRPPYEVLGPSPPGERCTLCGAGRDVKQIHYGGEPHLWHPACADGYLAARDAPPIKAWKPTPGPTVARAAAEPVPPHCEPDPDLAWLSPQAHTLYDCSPGGTVTVRTRQPDKSWSASKPLSQCRVILFPSDRIKPASAALGREPQGNGAVKTRRPPSWSDPRDMPRPGDCCSSCHGGTWWTEDVGPRGWRCGICHPPPIPNVRQVPT